MQKAPAGGCCCSQVLRKKLNFVEPRLCGTGISGGFELPDSHLPPLTP